jgi:hypothetical protein
MHPELLRAASGLAKAQHITVGQLLRNLLCDEIRRRHTAKPPAMAYERLVAPLRARLAEDLAQSRGWVDLQTRLNAKGYVLRAEGG